MATKVGFLRRMWNEKPELVGSSGFALLGIAMLVGANWYYYKNNKDNRRYRQAYTVIRHDDPKVATLRKDYLGDM